MAIKLVQAERGIYALLLQTLDGLEFERGSDCNKYKKARDKVKVFVTKKFDKVHAKAYPNNAS